MSSNRDGMTKEYAADEIVVEWEPRLCFHSRNCVRSLPQVFDESRRPWVQVDAAGADEVEAAVARCPSGALRTRRVGGVRPRQGRPSDVCASADGPLFRGTREIFAHLHERHPWQFAAAHRRLFADHRDARESDATGQLIEYFRGTDELEAAPGVPADAEVVDVPEESRYELRLGG